ncbi:response regulator transcription factor [Actinoplanes sp. KI2]|uniref:helix-turn-helix transcriptional regulator n=1 Tax=Actinoplanes sp. KI2 TaxID=2983315 RepID=UPI0021D5ECCB|nr:response regulator transcription factor [Actinoplanes sp. KI2]MCU7728462.1 response regulator transcription factor [Actinoplanes sp. KI2]
MRLGLVAMLLAIDSVDNVVCCGDAEESRFVGADGSEILAVSSRVGLAELDELRTQVDEAGMRMLMLLHSLDDLAYVEFSQRFAHGVVMLEDITIERLRHALDWLDRRGEVMLPGDVAGRILQESAERRREPVRRQPVLTPRESSILALLAEGYSNKQIAPRVGITHHGVKRNVANILAKLNCANRTQAVSLALHEGLLG